MTVADASLESLQTMVSRTLGGQSALSEVNAPDVTGSVVGSRRDQANNAEPLAHVQTQLDRLAGRVARIERDWLRLTFSIR
jgi:hypothetical protein